MDVIHALMAFALKTSAILTFGAFVIGVNLAMGGVALIGSALEMKLGPAGGNAFVPFAAGLLLLEIATVFLWPMLSVLIPFG